MSSICIESIVIPQITHEIVEHTKVKIYLLSLNKFLWITTVSLKPTSILIVIIKGIIKKNIDKEKVPIDPFDCSSVYY